MQSKHCVGYKDKQNKTVLLLTVKLMFVENVSHEITTFEEKKK